MANTDVVTPTRHIFLVGDVAFRRAVAEGTLSKFAAANNYVVTRIYQNEKITFSGFLSANTFDNGAGGIIRIRRAAQVTEYNMYIRDTGSSGTSSMNANVHSSNGTLLGTLFGANSLSMSGSNGQDVLLGVEDVDTIPVNFDANTTAHTIGYGTLNFPTFDAGDYIVPFIEGGGKDAFNLTFNLKIQEL